MRTFVKDPDAVLDYKFNWSDWLATGETISSATVTVQSGLSKDSQTNSTTDVTVWLSGGANGQVYTVQCRITTNQLRTDDRTFLIRVSDR